MNTIEQQRVSKVLDRMQQMVSPDSDPENAAVFAPCLEQMLDALACEDFFGTEGQDDPRGDFRNGMWNMEHVQGVDDQ